MSSMSRGGSRRGGERGSEFSQTGPDGWAVAGGSGPARPPPKAGDLSNFGKISKATPMTFGPSSVFAGKKESKREAISRTNSSSNMFSMLSQNPEAVVEASASKSSRPPSRKASVDFSQTGVAEAPPQRKRLILQPRSKPPVEEIAPIADSESSSEDETDSLNLEMAEAEALKKINEDSKEFFGVRNLEEAELYFKRLPSQHHFRLVDKLASSAIESKESDAKLVAEFLTLATTKDLCTAAAIEEGFIPIAEMLDDIAIDAPKAFELMAIMVNGAGLDEDQRGRISSKSADNSEKLLALLS
jgi:translation initiation factor 4G